MIVTNKYNAPQYIVDYVKKSLYRPTDNHSPSSLTEPPQIRQLKKRYWDKIEVDVRDFFNRMKGTAVHEFVNRAVKPSIKSGIITLSEVRIDADTFGFDGERKDVKGYVDLLEIDLRNNCGEISDLKTATANQFYGVKKDWETQLNIYRWLLHRNGIHIDRLQIDAWLMDWSIMKVRGDYPESPFHSQVVSTWAVGDTAQYIKERIELHEMAERLSDVELPMCSEEDKWTVPTVWKVYKGKNKRAMPGGANFETEEEAIEWAKKKEFKTRIEKEDGMDRRCEMYCTEVRPFCQQYGRDK